LEVQVAVGGCTSAWGPQRKSDHWRALCGLSQCPVGPALNYVALRRPLHAGCRLRSQKHGCRGKGRAAALAMSAAPRPSARLPQRRPVGHAPPPRCNTHSGDVSNWPPEALCAHTVHVSSCWRLVSIWHSCSILVEDREDRQQVRDHLLHPALQWTHSGRCW
jgi:hypothetical protein